MTGEYKNRKAGLMLFGILQIILGAFCALFVPLMALAAFAGNMTGQSETNAAAMLPSIIIYVLAAVWFISMGVGSIKGRRWARAIILISASIWLVCGVLTMVFMLFIASDMFSQVGGQGELPAEMVRIVQVIMFVFMGVVYVALPGGLVLFYKSPHVKATCDHLNPAPCWTDRCPLPVLGLSYMAVMWLFCAPMMAAYNFAVPLCGSIVSGWVGAAVMIAAILLLAYIAWGSYQLSVKAWWCALVLTLLWVASTAFTFTRITLIDYYEAMNFPEEQLEMMKQYSFMQPPVMIIMVACWGIVFIAYLLYIKKFFAPSKSEEL